MGRHLTKEKAIQMTAQEFLDFTEETMDQLLPIYDIIVGKI